MSWLQFGGWLAAVGLASAAACGGSTADAARTVGPVEAGAVTDAGVEDASVSDAALDAPADALEPVASCAGLKPADVGDGTTCEVNGPSAVSCSGELRFRYFCGSTTTPPIAPPIAGCVFSTWAFGMFDCPAAIVRNADNDSRCPGLRAFEVPSADGVTAAVPMGPGCGPLIHMAGTTPSELLACCP